MGKIFIVGKEELYTKNKKKRKIKFNSGNSSEDFQEESYLYKLGGYRAIWANSESEAIKKYSKFFKNVRLTIDNVEVYSSEWDFWSGEKYNLEKTVYCVIPNYVYTIDWLMKNMTAEDFKEWWYETRRAENYRS